MEKICVPYRQNHVTVSYVVHSALFGSQTGNQFASENIVSQVNQQIPPVGKNSSMQMEISAVPVKHLVKLSIEHNFLPFFSKRCTHHDNETWYVAFGTMANHNLLKNEPGLTLTYFKPRSNLVT